MSIWVFPLRMNNIIFKFYYDHDDVQVSNDIHIDISVEKITIMFRGIIMMPMVIVNMKMIGDDGDYYDDWWWW